MSKLGKFTASTVLMLASALGVAMLCILSVASPAQAATTAAATDTTLDRQATASMDNTSARKHTAHFARAKHHKATHRISSRITAPPPYTVVPQPRTPQWWEDRHTALVKKAATGGITTVFFGDSITEGMNEQLLAQTFGATATHFGISGDSTQHLLWRMQHGELNFTAPAPKLAIILIGTNNLHTNTRLSQAERHDVFLGVKANVDYLRKTLPGTKVLVLGILPREASPQHPLRAEIAAINAEIATLQDNRNVWFADISKQMLEADGTLSRTVMSDLLHPTSNVGYERMFNAIKPYVNKIPN